MACGRRGRDLTIRVAVAPEPMSAEAVDAVESLLARLVARAYLADHPELLPRQLQPSPHSENAGPPSTARAAAVAPAAQGGGSEELEQGNGELETSTR